MSIVVDLGCQDYGSQDSLTALVEEYKPTRIYGFDPSPNLDETVTTINGTKAELRRQAAWLHDGEVSVQFRDTYSAVGDGGQMVPCFDLSAWLRDLNRKLILKMDIEGAEYALLDRLLADGTSRFVKELVVEWHGDKAMVEDLTGRLPCPIREWWM